MTLRTYDNSLRKQSAAATVARIVEATAALHAERGALGTTHADIAQVAGVSLATVYKHFPTREALLPHCTGLVVGKAPAIARQALLDAPEPQAQLAMLVAALHAQYAYFHPWRRWHARDAHALPFLQELADGARAQTESLVRAVLDSAAGAPVDDAAYAMAMVVLDYPAWQRLTQMLRDPRQVADCCCQALSRLLPQITPPQRSNA
ncbi:MAG TPA: TetR/AcrR family transcriptional regulator [Burkholderiaceae bacterium]